MRIVVALIEGASGDVEVDARRHAAADAPGKLGRAEAAGADARVCRRSCRATVCVITLTTPPIADDPYTADAAPLSTSIRSTLSSSSVARLVTPDGRPSMSSSDRLLMPENCGRKPRMPMPESAPLYWTTSTPAFFFSTSVRSAATDALDVGRVDHFDLLRRLRQAGLRRAGR